MHSTNFILKICVKCVTVDSISRIVSYIIIGSICQLFNRSETIVEESQAPSSLHLWTNEWMTNYVHQQWFSSLPLDISLPRIPCISQYKEQLHPCYEEHMNGPCANHRKTCHVVNDPRSPYHQFFHNVGIKEGLLSLNLPWIHQCTQRILHRIVVQKYNLQGEDGSWHILYRFSFAFQSTIDFSYVQDHKILSLLLSELLTAPWHQKRM